MANRDLSWPTLECDKETFKGCYKPQEIVCWRWRIFFFKKMYDIGGTFWSMSFMMLSVRTYVFHLLRTYVIFLCNWLILWQNTLYLYLGRSRMCLIFQETCCSSLVLKPWRLDQETSEEKLFIKAGQIARQLLDTSRHLWTDSSIAARHLSIATNR